MKTFAKPMIITILFGLLCALAFVVLTMGSSTFIFWRFIFRLVLWSYLTCYAIVLAQWGQGRATLMVFPLFLLLFMSIFERSHILFLLSCLCIFSWIRSSLCFQTSLFMMLASEALLSLGGGVLIGWLNPQTKIAWALGILMFFLVQSLYFVFPQKAMDRKEQREDQFERAYKQVEKILSATNLSQDRL